MIKYPFYIGQWQATPATNILRLGESVKQLEPKAMDVLILLCQRQNDVLSADEIADECWGSAEIGDNPVHKAITQLRKALGDKASSPTYIETIRKRGYRIIADVSFPLESTQEAPQSEWQGGSPFPGLSAFESSDATVFFGRNEQIATLLKQVSKQIERGRAFCLILGPSGTGKSSLVNAGVVPQLTARQGYDGNQVVSQASLDFADIGKDRLLLDFAGALLDWDVNGIPVFDGMSADALASTLKQEPHKAIELCQLACNNSQQADSELKHHLFLFIDRLEILLSSPLFSLDDRNTLLALIEQLTTSGSVIVFSACRNDFYPLVVNQPSLMIDKPKGSHFDLTAPTHADLSQMIRLPAIAANLSWAKDNESGLGLDEILTQEASNNPDSLPMLQYTLQELYLQRSDDNELQISVYQTLGGIEGAIGKKAEEIHQQLPASHQQELAYVLSLLVTLNADGKTITSRAARWSQLQTKSQKDFVQAMVDSRLFVSHLQNGEPCFSVAHEALLRRWSRASEWIEDHREGLTVKSRLQELSQRWLNEDKNSAYLLTDGKPLQEALTLRSNSAFTLEAQELDLIRASTNRAKVKRWSKRAVVTLLCLLTFTSILMSYKSQQSEYLAQQKRLEAEGLMGFMVGEFADKLRSVRRMDLLDGISNKAIEYFSDASDENNQLITLPFARTGRGFEERFQHAQTLEAMGEVAYSRAKTDEALTAFSEAKVLLEKLLEEEPTNLDLLKVLGANAFWLGQLDYNVSDFDSAEPLFKQYLKYSERMYDIAPYDFDALLELSYARNTLGSLYLRQNSYQLAKENFEASLMLKSKALKKRPDNLTLLTDRADTLTWLATMEQHLGNLSEALILYQQAELELEKILGISPNDANTLESLSYATWYQADILSYSKNFSLSYEKVTKAAYMLSKAIEQDPENKVWSRDLQSIHLLEIIISSRINKEEHRVNSTDLLSNLNNILKFPVSRPRVIIEAINYYQETKDWKQSGLLVQKIEEHLLSFPMSNKKEPNYISILAEFNISKARQLAYSSMEEKQMDSCQFASNLLKPLVKQSNNVFYLLPYVKAHSCLNRLNNVAAELDKLKNMGVADFNF